MRKSKLEGLQDEIIRQMNLRIAMKEDGYKSWSELAREYKTTKQNLNQIKRTILRKMRKIREEASKSLDGVN